MNVLYAIRSEMVAGVICFQMGASAVKVADTSHCILMLAGMLNDGSSENAKLGILP